MKYLLLCMLLIISCSKTGTTEEELKEMTKEEWRKTVGVEQYFQTMESQEIALAIAQEDTATLRTLLLKTVDINAYGLDSINYASWAILKQAPKSLSLLLEVGADPNRVLKKGNTLVTLSCDQKDTTYLRIVLEKGGNPNVAPPSFFYTSVIHRCQDANMYEHVQLLLRYGADVNTRGLAGQTLLVSAGSLLNEKYIRLHLQHGADPLSRDKNGRTFYDAFFNRQFYSPEEEILRDSLIADLVSRGIDASQYIQE